MIELKNISVTFEQKGKTVRAVQDVSLHINRGEIFGIVGTSGAGKSTLLRTINLLQPPTTGKIFIADHDITNVQGIDLRKIRTQTGMIFQHFNLINTKTVYHNIAFALKAAQAKSETIDARVTELLEMVSLSDRRNAYPGQLSGGQKQRVGIARALANNPQILLCDEATSALDLETTNSILELLKEINRKTGITMILITHEMAVVKAICDRVAVMSQGSIVEIGNVLDIFAQPREPFTQQLIAYSNDLKLPQRLREDIQGPIYKIVYRGGKAEEPVLSDTAQLYPVKLNIIHGKIEYIGDQPLGIILVNILGDLEPVKQAVSYIQSRVDRVEVYHD